MPSIEMFLTLGTLVFKAYEDLSKQGHLNSNLLPANAGKVADALKIVLKDEFFAKFPNPSVDDVLGAIEKFQLDLSKVTGVLDVDGFIGQRFLSKLGKNAPCKGEMKWTPSTEAVAANSGITPGTRMIRWFLDDTWTQSPPAVEGGFDALVILKNAIFAWNRFAEIDSLRALQRKRANLIITQIGSDGVGGVLADAHVGPPDGMVRTLRLDAGETWNKDKLFFTIAHEFGHVLGLNHLPGSGALMSTFYQPGIKGPTPTDIQALANMGYKLRNPPFPEVITS